jgi:hypothetical protein
MWISKGGDNHEEAIEWISRLQRNNNRRIAASSVSSLCPASASCAATTGYADTSGTDIGDSESGKSWWFQR